MLNNEHECFFPPTVNCTLWRYMDLTKLLSLLENRSLFFPRADQLNDPYEGAWSRAGVALLRDPGTSGGVPPEAVDQLLKATEDLRRNTFISCWFAREHESAAMWKLYLQSPEGVAIRTDHDTLGTALERSPLVVRTTMVKYVDYDKVPIPFRNALFPFVHKRLSFEHETELRAIIWSLEDVNNTQIPKGATGVMVDIIPEELIKSVYVSPTAPKWFGHLVEQILRRYGLSTQVVRSSLYDRPSY
ncbi:MAG: hypothetical protein E3K32_10850 [wastewater metagenome]|nr:hypothetical protein [Candidatus Loosdrechtia aerotolerans]